MSILGSYSHGCHRLFNVLAVRLFSFILRHHEFVRGGQTKVGYEWRFEHRGDEFQFNLTTRGYYYTLKPAIAVDVLPGKIHGERKEPYPDYVKKPSHVYQEDLPQSEKTTHSPSSAPRVKPQQNSILSDEQTL